MIGRKGESRVCLYCSHEIKLYNNDQQFSWDLHKQEEFHIGRRQSRKKKMNSKEESNIYVQHMKNLFQSDANINSWADELVRLANDQLTKLERNVIVQKAVTGAFAAVYRGIFHIVTFGSRVTGLAVNEFGDLDLYVDTSDNETLSLIDNPELENHYLRKLGEYMRTEESNVWANVESVLACRTPIIRALHYDTKMKCDITVMNGFGIINTNLMLLFIDNIPKLRPLILIIREWSLASGFTKERDINNYALSMLVLYYLQQEKYAPSVDELKFDYSGSVNIISGYECIDYDKVNYNWKGLKDSNQASLKQLLLEFFTLYKCFDFKNNVVCPLLGRPVKKTLFIRSVKKLPPEMYTYVKKLQNRGEPIRVNENSMCIQDPLDLAHNLTKSASERFTDNFVDLCDSSVRALKGIH